MLKIEMLTVETVGALKPLLLELADYHNQTALNFRGLYPLVCADEKMMSAAVLTIFISGRSCVGRGRERC